MLQNKITRGLVFALIFVVVLDLGLLVGGNTLGTNSNQLASVSSIQSKGDLPLQNEDKSRGGESANCLANPQIAINYTQYDDFGNGDLATPYEIWTAKQFVDIANAGLTPYHYLQCADISFTGVPQFTIPHFVGFYHGNLKYLQNFKYNGASTDFVGMFERIDGALLENMRLSTFTMQLTSQTGMIAALVGEATGSIIDDVKLYNSTITAPFSSAAALVSTSSLSEITNTEISNAIVRAKYNAAGLVNASVNSKIKNIKINGGTVLAVEGKGAGVVNAFDSNQFTPVSGVFENIYYKGTSVSGIHVAGIANSLDNATLAFVTAESILAAMASTDNHTSIGGVVGQASNAILHKVHFDGSIMRNANTANPDCGFTDFAGGVAGLLYGSSIEWSYSSGQIKVSNNCGGTGGVVGTSINGTVQNSHADIGFNISGTNGPLGGLVGYTLNSEGSNSFYLKNRTIVRILPSTGASVTVLGSHLGLVVSSGFPSDLSYTGGSLPNIATVEAGPYVGMYSDVSGNNNVPDSIYYIESYPCGFGNCNNLGTPKSQAYLLNPTNSPTQTWDFSPSKWVQIALDAFPRIPSAKSN